jgi:predicted Zn-dependent protease
MPALPQRFAALLPAGPQWASLRLVRERSEQLCLRNGVALPPSLSEDHGAMVTVVEAGGAGYAGTSDLSDAGLSAAIAQARRWAAISAARSAIDWATVPAPAAQGRWQAAPVRPWGDAPLADKLDALRRADAVLGGRAGVVERSATLWHTAVETRLWSTAGADVEQAYELLVPDLEAVASAGGETARRTLASRGLCRQSGLELLDTLALPEHAARIGEEAVALLSAERCPSGTMDLVLAPDQMLLQIHESIGHPLELDRILGDERNYAGTSFVKPEMFGSYRYGSELLSVTFDPTVPGEFASAGYDDDGSAASRAYLIRDGVLLRPLGSALSGARAGLPAVANARATSWNRPPIDRMANLNVEPGALSEAALIASVERGVLMRTNTSWSIDDSRNKFQFGCEIGWRIVDGQLGAMVRNPCYRGISATFWRNLVGVGDRSTWEIYGSPFCGKGEPNQIIRVGHGAPMCRFAEVEVFSGG